MKKLLSLLFALWLAVGHVVAATVIDTPSTYWAAKEIAYCIKEGIINLYADNSYRPELDVKRAEFNSMLLRALGHKPTEIDVKNKFKDLNQNYWAYGDIMKSEEIGLLYGYPDGTFKPESYITKTEVASIISHITKDEVKNIGTLNIFVDSSEIPAWGRKQYAKSIELGIYVNHPDAAELLPNKVLNRAEAAVLFYRLRQAMGAVKQEYVGENVTQDNNANLKSEDKVKKITVTNFRRIVLSANVLRLGMVNNQESAVVQSNKTLKFTFVNDINREDGVVLIPKGSVLNAEVALLEPQKPVDESSKISVEFDSLVLPNGKTIEVSGRVIDNKGDLVISRITTIGKAAGYALDSAALGVGSGVGIAAVSDTPSKVKGVGMGLASGVGAGTVTGLVTPGFTYKIDADDSLFVELIQDLDVEDETL